MLILGYQTKPMIKPTRKVKGPIGFLVFFLAIVSGCQPNITVTTEVDTPTPTLSSIQQAEQVLSKYYTALTDRDYVKAASFFTTAVGINRSDLIQIWEDNANQGWRLTGYEITDQRQYDEKRIVFWLNVTQEGIEPYQFDTINVLHLEENGWFVGNSVLEKLAIQGNPKTVNQVTAFPGLVLRAVSGYEVWLNIKNDSSHSIIWGTEGETCGTLFFGSEAINAPCPSLSTRIETGQTLDIFLTFLVDVFTRPPDDLPTTLDVSLLQWDADNNGNPDPASEPWTFHFDLEYDNP